MRGPSLEHVRAARQRWQTRLTRAVNAIRKLDATERLLLKKAAEPAVERRASPAPASSAVETDHLNERQFERFVEAQPAAAADDIPTFLRRKPLSDADKAAAEAIKAAAAERAKKKKAGQAATRKAKLSGETRRMPLTGKAALDAIKNA